MPKLKKSGRPSNPPTLPLNTHPVLGRSLSQENLADSTDDVAADGKRPKNRAPPPPPSKTKSKPPRGFAHQVSHPPPQPPSSSSTTTTPPQPTEDTSSGREEGSGGVRVSRPPPAYRRTKSDQKVNGEDDQPSSLSPQTKDEVAIRGRLQPPNIPRPNPPAKHHAKKKSTPQPATPPNLSPLAVRKNVEGVRISGYGSGGEGIGGRGGGGGVGGVGGVGGPPSRPPPRAPGPAASGGVAHKRKRFSAADVDEEGRGKDSPLVVCTCNCYTWFKLSGKVAWKSSLLSIIKQVAYSALSDRNRPWWVTQVVHHPSCQYIQ